MRKSALVLVLMCSAFAVQAAPPVPPCWPSQLGSTGSSYKTGLDGGVRWIGWTCTVGGKSLIYGAVALEGYRIKHPDTAKMSPTRTAIAYWVANVETSSSTSLAPGWAAMRRAFGPRALAR